MARKIAEIVQQAADAGRSERLEFVAAHLDRSIDEPRKHAEQHRETFGQLEEAGFTAVVVSPVWGEAPKTEDWAAEISELFIRP